MSIALVVDSIRYELDIVQQPQAAFMNSVLSGMLSCMYT